MRAKFITIIFTVLVLLLGANLPAKAGLTDPYEIMNKYYQTAGGLDKFKAEKSSYSEGNLEIIGSGLSGTIKQWNAETILMRMELDLGIFKQTTGNNGEITWSVDPNGKLQISKDIHTLQRQKVSRLMAEFDQLDPQSKNFRMTLDGIDTVGDRACYIIRLSNSINQDTALDYIDTADFLIRKHTDIRPDETTIDVFSDYREVNGIMRPYKHDIEILPVGQKMSLVVTKFESNPHIDPALFQPPETDVKDFLFSDNSESESMPFVYSEDHILIPVNINGRERYWILDSGAGMSVIDSAFAESIGLTVEGKIKGSGIGNTVDVYFVTIPEYSLQGLRLNSQTVAAINLQELLKRTGWDAVGIMGYDFLSRFITKIDYANQIITFYDPEYFNYNGNGVIVDATMQAKFLTLPMKVEDNYIGRWNLDTGAGGCSFHYPFAVSHGFDERKGIDKISFGAGGSLKERMIKVGDFELAGFKLNDQLVDYPLEKSVGAFSGQELIGNMGNGFMKNFVLYLDYKDQQVIVEKGKDFGKKFPHDRSGLQIFVGDDGYEIYFVSPGTPADKAGFKKGDIIKTVNDIDVQYLKDLSALRDLFRKDANISYQVGIERDGKAKVFDVKLADLL